MLSGLVDCSLASLRSDTSAYPPGAVLLVEDQAARGIFVLCQGRVKLSLCSRDGKTLILRIAEPERGSRSKRYSFGQAVRTQGGND